MRKWITRLFDPKSPLNEPLAWESVSGAEVKLVESCKYEYKASPVMECKRQEIGCCIVVYMDETCIQIIPYDETHAVDVFGVLDTELLSSPTTLRFAFESSVTAKKPTCADITWNIRFRPIHSNVKNKTKI